MLDITGLFSTYVDTGCLYELVTFYECYSIVN